MKPNSKRIYLHALTPLHSGVGQAAAIVDLPIAREKATNWPVVPGSSVKGVLRDRWKGESWEDAAFGSPGSGPDDPGNSGGICFTDLRILCLPVRSFYGTFAWVTSPLVLQRFTREDAALASALSLKVPATTDENALVAPGSALPKDGKLFLEDLDLNAQESVELKAVADALAGEVFAGQALGLAERFALVSDTIFDFLCETATEVMARIALGEGGTTSGKGGNLWYEEAVPAEAIFSGWLVASGYGNAAPLFERLAGETVVQIGGNAGVGRGLCRLVVAP